MASVYVSPSTQEDNVGVGNYGTEEQRMNELATIVINELARHEVATYRNNPKWDLYQVVTDSNEKQPDIHLALHSNAGGGRGCEVFCYKFGSIGGDLARSLYNNLSGLTPSGDRGVKQGYNFYGNGRHMYEVAYTNAPAVLIEVAFHDNLEDVNWLLNNMTNIGVTIAKCLLFYFDIPYIEPPKPKPEPTTKTVYRCLVGSFANEENAKNQAEQIKKAGFDCVVIKFEV